MAEASASASAVNNRPSGSALHTGAGMQAAAAVGSAASSSANGSVVAVVTGSPPHVRRRMGGQDEVPALSLQTDVVDSLGRSLAEVGLDVHDAQNRMDEDTEDQDGNGPAPGVRGSSQATRPGTASAGAVRRALLAAPPLPPPAQPPPSAFAGGVVVCPICEAHAFQTARGLMGHITAMHVGVCLSEDAADVLRRLDRAVCTERQCGGINRIGMRQCNRCKRAVTLRTLQAGDVVPAPMATAMPSLAQVAASQVADVARSQASQAAGPDPVDVSLPLDWAARVRKLPSTTMVHVPIAFRVKHTQAWTTCMEGVAEGLPGYCMLEEARSKILLGECPKGVYAPRELGARFHLWQTTEFEQLLVRAESQALLRSEVPRRNTAK